MVGKLTYRAFGQNLMKYQGVMKIQAILKGEFLAKFASEMQFFAKFLRETEFSCIIASIFASETDFCAPKCH